MYKRQETPLISFDFDDHTPEQLAELPEWMREKVQAGKALLAEQRARTEPPPHKHVPPDLDIAGDDIPF